MKRILICLICILCLSVSVFADEPVDTVVDEPVDTVVDEPDFSPDSSNDVSSGFEISFDHPLAVYQVDPPDISSFALVGDVYQGSISDSLLKYLSGFVGPFDDYLIYRNSQYEYTVIYGGELVRSSFSVSCTDCERVTLNTRDFLLTRSQGSYSVNCYNSYYVYSNLDGFSQLDFLRELKQYEFIKILLLATFIAYFLRSVLGIYTR